MDTGAYMQNQMDDLITSSQHQYDDFLKESKKDGITKKLIKLKERAILENWSMKDVGEEFFKTFAYNEMIFFDSQNLDSIISEINLKALKICETDSYGRKVIRIEKLQELLNEKYLEKLVISNEPLDTLGLISPLEDVDKSNNASLCFDCEKEKATHGIGVTKLLCGKCWNQTFKKNFKNKKK